MVKRSNSSATSVAVVVVALMAASAAAVQIQFNKPKAPSPLPNPSIIAASRDDVLRLTKQMLETRDIPVDKEECNAATGECTLISKPMIFVKGIPTKSQLQHYSEVSDQDVRNWARGRYVVRIQISPASPSTSQVGVYAKFEGLVDQVTGSEWVTLASRGEMEDKLLRCILDRVQGGDCKADSR